MAITVISKVPVTSGTMPKAPDDPTWSARMAVCGLHCVPNRKSIGETFSKNRTVSNSTENTIPIVVSTATLAQASRTTFTARSTWLRARKVVESRRKPKATPSRPKTNPPPRIRLSAKRRTEA